MTHARWLYRDAMTTDRPLITRVDLAKALEELVADDGRLAGALALCEAWEPGYLGQVLARAEVLAANDAENSNDAVSVGRPEPIRFGRAPRPGGFSSARRRSGLGE